MRFLGLALLAAAAALAGWFGPGTPLGAVIFGLWPAFLNTFQAGVQRRVAPELWDYVILPVLEWPSWVMPAGLGLVFLLLGLRRRQA